MPYLYPYIAIYRGPKKGDEMKKYLISHMKGMDEVVIKEENLSLEFRQTLNMFDQQQTEANRQINHLTELIHTLHKTIEERQVTEF